MPERLYWVTLRTLHVDGGERQFRFAFACAFTTVAELAAELRDAGVVHGERLRLGEDEHGGRFVRGREEYMFGAGVVATVQAYAHPVAGL